MISFIHLKAVALAVLIILLGILCCSTLYYRQQAQQWKKQAKEQTQIIKAMQQRQQYAAILDKKYTQELAEAHNEIEKLRADVAAGNKRLHLNARCSAASTASLDDATAARLTADAEQNYYRLRGQISTITGQVKGLQEYIQTQCFINQEVKK